MRTTLLAFTVTLSACASAPAPAPSWSDSAPVVQPTKAPTPEKPVGRAVVRTISVKLAATKSSPGPAAYFLGFRLYTGQGALVEERLSRPEPKDVLALEPGRYIAVGTVERTLFERRERTIQFVIAAGETTYVELLPERTETR